MIFACVNKNSQGEIMLNKIDTRSTATAFSTTINLKETNADEFQAKLNELKKDEKGDEVLKNQDLDLDISKLKANFVSYAQGKMYEDGLKKAEEEHLNQLFAIIDKGNANR